MKRDRKSQLRSHGDYFRPSPNAFVAGLYFYFADHSYRLLRDGFSPSILLTLLDRG